MGKCGGGCSGGKKYKHKPTGKMIKDIKQMAPGKKIGGDMVYPMSATLPYGWASSLSSFAKKITNPLKKTAKNLEVPQTSTIQKINNFAEKAQPTLNALSTVASIGGSIAQAVNSGGGQNNSDSPAYNTTQNPDIGYTKTKTGSSGSKKKTVNKNTYNITITNNNQKGGRGRRMMDGRPMARRLEYQGQMQRPQIAQAPPSYEKYNQNAKIYGSIS
jgi:hypothetical protein